ncbi:hypothetical protein C8R43DRAFT_958671 [Mycena crocata]|nr:hypothetical protein C8R43DRAFT_958671 [Mycena crocata]
MAAASAMGEGSGEQRDMEQAKEKGEEWDDVNAAGAEEKATVEAQGEEARAEESDDAKRARRTAGHSAMAQGTNPEKTVGSRSDCIAAAGPQQSPDPVETGCARGAGAVVAHQACRESREWMAEHTSTAGVSRRGEPPASPCSTGPLAWDCWMNGAGQTSFASRYCKKTSLDVGRTRVYYLGSTSYSIDIRKLTLTGRWENESEDNASRRRYINTRRTCRTEAKRYYRICKSP